MDVSTAFMHKIIRSGCTELLNYLGQMLELPSIMCPDPHCYFPAVIYKISWLTYYKAKDSASPLCY